jgi:prepilin-type N-terminal cleavage/methylation domain-containing protein/prepilin-type processing-associated H-X9-DG protein
MQKGTEDDFWPDDFAVPDFEGCDFHAFCVKLTQNPLAALGFPPQIFTASFMLKSFQGIMIDQARRRAGAFSLIELLCVMAIIGVLAALLLPALNKARAQAKRVQCVNHLRQTGIAFQNFAQDHNGQFPMSVPVNAGGSLEFARNAYGIAGEFYFSFHHFQVLSNELVTPKVVICPADKRQPAANFAVLGNQCVSYFVGINAVPASPDSILAGDRNLTNDWAKPATLLHFGPNNSLRWTAELHQFKGNLLFADGRVEEKNTAGLMGSGKQPLVVADLAMPTIAQGPTSASFSRGTGSGGLPLQGGFPAAPPVAQATSQNQVGNPREDVQTMPKATTTSVPGWGTGFTSGLNQPDPPLMPAHLQPGTSLSISNSTHEISKTEDPGFSLFPPLLGRGGMLNSKGGHWALLILALFVVFGSGILLRRRLAKSQLLRKACRDILQT